MGDPIPLVKSFDFVLGCDGAYSLVRRKMSQRPYFDCQVQYAWQQYVEITIPPTRDGKVSEETTVVTYVT